MEIALDGSHTIIIHIFCVVRRRSKVQRPIPERTKIIGFRQAAICIHYSRALEL
jgi:hypothetical protein